MTSIVPAILPKSFDDLIGKIARLQNITDEVQIDIVDLESPEKITTWPYTEPTIENPEEKAFLYTGSLTREVDLMIDTYDTRVGRWIEAGAQRITIHADRVRDLPGLIQKIKKDYAHDVTFKIGLFSFGLAIGVDTDTSLIEPYLDECDYVQFMGISRIGKQGEVFEKSILDKIASFQTKHPNMLIQVDGGVTLDNVPSLIHVGVTRLIVGSALWNAPDLAEAYAKFIQLSKECGLTPIS